jgi:hypothetical protein
MGCGKCRSTDATPAYVEANATNREKFTGIVEKTRSELPESIEPNSSTTRRLRYSLSKLSSDELKNFNVLCWTDDPGTLMSIREKPYSLKVLLSGVCVHLTYATENSRPSISDCVLYLITEMEQLNEARKFRARYRQIWTHFVMCELPDTRLVVEELNAELVTEDTLVVRLMSSFDREMELLRKVFDSIDIDHNGVVDVNELQIAAASFFIELSSDDIEETMSVMDFNKNGTIEYSEFVEWWRSGRQKAFKLSTFVDSLSKRLAAQVPEAIKMIKSMHSSMLLTKQMSTKELTIGIGRITDTPQVTCRIEFGTAARRERLMYVPSDAFGWLSKEYCLILAFKAIDNFDAANLMNLITSTIELVLSTLQERTLIRQQLDYRVLMLDDALYFGITLDVRRLLLDPLLKLIDPWLQLLEAPVDQSLIFEFKSKSLGSLDPSFLNVKVEHWSKIPMYLLKTIWRFLSRIGLEHLEPVFSQSRDASLAMNFEGSDELQKSWIFEQFKGFKSYIQQLSADLTSVAQLYRELTSHAAPIFDAYFRFENLGLKTSFTSTAWPSSWEVLGYPDYV